MVEMRAKAADLPKEARAELAAFLFGGIHDISPRL